MPRKERNYVRPPVVPDKTKPNKRQCTAHRRDGQRCTQSPIRGGTVCRMHGGSAPQVQKSARAYLAEQVQPSITRLVKERDGAPKSADRIRAAVALLDRAGFGAKMTIEVDDNREMLIERLRDLRARGPEALLALQASATDDDDDTIDAEVIEEGDEAETTDTPDKPDPKRERRG